MATSDRAPAHRRAAALALARRSVPEPARPLAKRVLRGGRRALRTLRRAAATSVTVRATGWDTVQTQLPGGLHRHRDGLSDGRARRRVKARRLRLVVPDLPTLTRVATCGLLTGWTHVLEVRVARVPQWASPGSRLPRTSRHTTELRWARTGDGLSLTLAWAQPRPLDRALSDALSAIGRDRRWGQAGGPMYVSDRPAWLAGQGTWPHGHLVERRPERPEGASPDAAAKPDPDAEPVRPAPVGPGPLGPFLSPPARLASAGPSSWGRDHVPLVTAVANPYGRVLTGAPAAYRLHVVGGGDRLVLRTERGADVLVLSADRAPESAGTWTKFCTVEVPADWPRTPFAALALQALAAAGAILVVPDAALRSALVADGLPAAATRPAADLAAPFPAYAASVASSQAATIQGDALLRWTALAGRTELPLPTVSITVSSKRVDDVERCLRYLADQTYPAYEVVLGTHGYAVAADVLARWQETVPVPLRVVPMPAALTLGESLGRLSRLADGDFLTKVDDDDHYGPNHLTDLVLAARTSGADLVAKSSRFTHFADLGVTVDRTWGAPEVFDVTPAGGTMLLPRAALYEMGGWSTSARHVDTDLIGRARALGAVRYRTHSLGYAYVRRSSGHTWAADNEALLQQGQARYPGLPAGVLGTSAPCTSPDDLHSP